MTAMTIDQTTGPTVDESVFDRMAELTAIGFSTDGVRSVMADETGLRIDFDDTFGIDFQDGKLDVLEDGWGSGYQDRFAAYVLALRLGIEDPQEAVHDLFVLHNRLLNPLPIAAGQGALFSARTVASPTSDGAYDAAILAEQARLTKLVSYRRDVEALDKAITAHDEEHGDVSREDAEREVSLVKADTEHTKEELEDAMTSIRSLDAIDKLRTKITARRARLTALRAQRDLPADQRVNPRAVKANGTITGTVK